MGERQAIEGARPGNVQPRVHVAIARAAAATGVDFRYLLAQARLESRLDPAARAQTSSAAGLYQFTSGTWLETVERHGGEHGLGWAQNAVSRGLIADPAHRAQVMALRHDPDASALMAAELADDHRTELRASLGREPDAAELYLAHFLGIGGAKTFLSRLAENPEVSAAALLPRAASANRAIFFAGDAPRSLAQVMDLIRGKMAGAMDEEVPVAPWTSHLSGGKAMQLNAAAPSNLPARWEAAPRHDVRSMADTLAATFGSPENGSAPVFRQVGRVYAKLARLGL